MSEKLENLNLGVNTKKRFTIDGDENRILEIDVHFSNDITEGTVDKLADTFTFTEKGKE